MKYLSLLLISFTACVQPKNSPPPAPTSTTAFVFAANFGGGSELQAIDVKTREAGRVLGADAISEDSLVRVFGEVLYIIGREFNGTKNTLTVIDPKNGYALACPECQWALGEATNVQDFWAVSKTKAYMTTQPGLTTAPSYEHRNEVSVINPTTGAITARIDIAAALLAAGDTLASEDPDGWHELGALYADNEHLFVAISALDSKSYFALYPTTGECGFVAGRVAVIDLDTDKVVKIIKLKGTNPAPSPARWVPEPNTNNVLISTPGPFAPASIEACGGVERIDQVTLEHKGYLFTEQEIGGSVMSFDLDSKQNGVAFVFTNGDYLAPTYEIRRFTKSGLVAEPLLAPGPKAFTSASFVEVNDRGQAYIGLPLRAGTKIGMYETATGAELGAALATDLPPIDVAFFPGPAFSR